MSDAALSSSLPDTPIPPAVSSPEMTASALSSLSDTSPPDMSVLLSEANLHLRNAIATRLQLNEAAIKDDPATLQIQLDVANAGVADEKKLRRQIYASLTEMTALQPYIELRKPSHGGKAVDAAIKNHPEGNFSGKELKIITGLKLFDKTHSVEYLRHLHPHPGENKPLDPGENKPLEAEFVFRADREGRIDTQGIETLTENLTQRADAIKRDIIAWTKQENASTNALTADELTALENLQVRVVQENKPGLVEVNVRVGLLQPGSDQLTNSPLSKLSYPQLADTVGKAVAFAQSDKAEWVDVSQYTMGASQVAQFLEKRISPEALKQLLENSDFAPLYADSRKGNEPMRTALSFKTDGNQVTITGTMPVETAKLLNDCNKQAKVQTAAVAPFTEKAASGAAATPTMDSVLAAAAKMPPAVATDAAADKKIAEAIAAESVTPITAQSATDTAIADILRRGGQGLTAIKPEAIQAAAEVPPARGVA